MNNEVIKWLVGTPASDMNFKTNLKRATAAEIRETLKIIEGRREVKTKEKALRAVISAARKWAARWTQIARECTFERLEEVAAE